MRTWYETASGESFELSGQRSMSGISGADLRGWELTRSGRAFERQERQLDVELSFAGSGWHERAMRFLELCDSGALSESPGRLHVGDWYLTCYVVKGSPSSRTSGGVRYDVTLVTDDQVWRRETTRHLLPNTGREMESETLDYPHDYGHDYGTSSVAGVTIDVPGVTPCDLRLTIYGHAVSPYVRIGSNTYQVNVTVPSGAILTIDTTRKGSMLGDSVVLRGRYGDEQDVFSKRLRGAEGSGSYIYELVPPGPQAVSWPQSFGVDLTLIERRGRLPWT